MVAAAAELLVHRAAIDLACSAIQRPLLRRGAVELRQDRHNGDTVHHMVHGFQRPPAHGFGLPQYLPWYFFHGVDPSRHATTLERLAEQKPRYHEEQGSFQPSVRGVTMEVLVSHGCFRPRRGNRLGLFCQPDVHAREWLPAASVYRHDEGTCDVLPHVAAARPLLRRRVRLEADAAEPWFARRLARRSAGRRADRCSHRQGHRGQVGLNPPPLSAQR
mmetsp:Transcript_85543/g.261609  ORF Transcript_85543/g.261609 Transcript_85543/m.261609 type:complete len:218 (-) Transcript_85543:319-972(-)